MMPSQVEQFTTSLNEENTFSFLLSYPPRFFFYFFFFTLTKLCAGKINSSDSDKFRGAVENVGPAYDALNFQTY